jgi:hypothetical protein
MLRNNPKYPSLAIVAIDKIKSNIGKGERIDASVIGKSRNYDMSKGTSDGLIFKPIR